MEYPKLTDQQIRSLSHRAQLLCNGDTADLEETIKDWSKYMDLTGYTPQDVADRWNDLATPSLAEAADQMLDLIKRERQANEKALYQEESEFADVTFYPEENGIMARLGELTLFPMGFSPQPGETWHIKLTSDFDTTGGAVMVLGVRRLTDE